ncbi:MAG: hypothetical protein U0793_08555 [Gemmataceae bacterium]
MSSSFRRFEILLPLKFNDGSEVPSALITETILELEQKFGAVSAESQTIHGHWRDQGVVFRDQLVRIFIDVLDISENRDFFSGFKETLKERFKQLEIWLTTFPVEKM